MVIGSIFPFPFTRQVFCLLKERVDLKRRVQIGRTLTTHRGHVCTSVTTNKTRVCTNLRTSRIGCPVLSYKESQDPHPHTKRCACPRVPLGSCPWVHTFPCFHTLPGHSAPNLPPPNSVKILTLYLNTTLTVFSDLFGRPRTSNSPR